MTAHLDVCRKEFNIEKELIYLISSEQTLLLKQNPTWELVVSTLGENYEDDIQAAWFHMPFGDNGDSYIYLIEPNKVSGEMIMSSRPKCF